MLGLGEGDTEMTNRKARNGYDKGRPMSNHFKDKNSISIVYKDGHCRESYFNEAWVEQEGECAICHRHETNLKRSLCIDHDHTTGLARGLLCSMCNSALGYLRDDEDCLLEAIRYLRKWKSSPQETPRMPCISHTVALRGSEIEKTGGSEG